nr:PREDICTED: uncharacterized protein LOC109040155 [Bemisia tabaci]
MAITPRWTHLCLLSLIIFFWSLWIPADCGPEEEPEIEFLAPPAPPLPERRLYMECRVPMPNDQINLFLYICVQKPKPVKVRCWLLERQEDIQRAYWEANFYVVSGLGVSRGWDFKIYNLKHRWPDSLMIGIEPKMKLTRLFQGVCEHPAFFRNTARNLLVPEFLNADSLDSLLDFYCINDLLVFSNNFQIPEASLPTYLKALRNVIGFYEQRFASPAPAPRGNLSPSFRRSGLMSSFRRRFSFGPSSAARNRASGGTSQRFSNVGSGSSYSPPRPVYPPPPSTPRDEATKRRLISALRFLMDKMIDPCMVQAPKGAPWPRAGLDPDVANETCDTFCKVLSISAKLNTDDRPEIQACKKLLGTGGCFGVTCSCHLSAKSERLLWGLSSETPMFAAHNILRFK